MYKNTIFLFIILISSCSVLKKADNSQSRQLKYFKINTQELKLNSHKLIALISEIQVNKEILNNCQNLDERNFFLVLQTQINNDSLHLELNLSKNYTFYFNPPLDSSFTRQPLIGHTEIDGLDIFLFGSEDKIKNVLDFKKIGNNEFEIPSYFDNDWELDFSGLFLSKVYYFDNGNYKLRQFDLILE